MYPIAEIAQLLLIALVVILVIALFLALLTPGKSGSGAAGQSSINFPYRLSGPWSHQPSAPSLACSRVSWMISIVYSARSGSPI